jgi:hypothetical protein
VFPPVVTSSPLVAAVPTEMSGNSAGGGPDGSGGSDGPIDWFAPADVGLDAPSTNVVTASPATAATIVTTRRSVMVGALMDPPPHA